MAHRSVDSRQRLAVIAQGARQRSSQIRNQLDRTDPDTGTPVITDPHLRALANQVADLAQAVSLLAREMTRD